MEPEGWYRTARWAVLLVLVVVLVILALATRYSGMSCVTQDRRPGTSRGAYTECYVFDRWTGRRVTVEGP